MLLNLYKKKWNEGLKNKTSTEMESQNSKGLKEMTRLSREYKEWIKKENK